MTLTPQQLETAARKFCELRKLDPDVGSMLAWAKDRVQYSLDIQEAIDFAAASEAIVTDPNQFEVHVMDKCLALETHTPSEFCAAIRELAYAVVALEKRLAEVEQKQ